MDLTLSRRADYVVRAAISLARHYDLGGYRKIREVAEEMELPPRYTPQILNLLLKAGLAEAKAGQKGGYRLKSAPEDIPLLSIVEAAGDPLRSSRCTMSGGPCHWESMCALHPIWTAAQDAFFESLAKTRLRDVCEIDKQLERATYPVPKDAHRLSGGGR